MKLYSHFQPFLMDHDDILSEICQACVLFSFIITWVLASGANPAVGYLFLSLQLVCLLSAVTFALINLSAEKKFAVAAIQSAQRGIIKRLSFRSGSDADDTTTTTTDNDADTQVQMQSESELATVEAGKDNPVDASKGVAWSMLQHAVL